MVLPEARVDADVRGDRRRLTVNHDCQLRMLVDGPAGRDVRIGDDDTSEYEGNRQNHDQHGARNVESRSEAPAFLLDDPSVVRRDGEGGLLPRMYICDVALQILELDRCVTHRAVAR